MPLQIAPVEVSEADRVLRRELRLFNLYRLLEAALLVLVVFGPVSNLLAEPRHALFAPALAIAYAFIAGVVLALGRRGDPRTVVLVGIASDLFFGVLSIHATPGIGTGIAIMLMFNVGAATLLLPPRLGLTVAASAMAAIVGEHAWTVGVGEATSRPLVEPVMFAVGYGAIGALMSLLGRQMRTSYELAERRGAEASQLSEINELIIRRLRTGVLLVDGQGRIMMTNEVAGILLGEVDDAFGARNLAVAAPELARRLEQWRTDGRSDESPLPLGPDKTDVVPRFARLLAGSDRTLVFLDDTSLASRRAESMTLATLGRFSASLAHEIRNPLAAIRYAVQLLEESNDIRPADRRLLEIVHQQGQRMNGIVENVLGLARREPAKPEHVELTGFVKHFVDEYLVSHPIEHDVLRATGATGALPALVDPRQLHQVLTVLVNNALNYGRVPGEPARVSVHVQMNAAAPTIEVRDRGPGIPEAVASRLFRPFFTTSAHGTGLGLYIARELCRANQASLDYAPMPAGGACFRIRLHAFGAAPARDRAPTA